MSYKQNLTNTHTTVLAFSVLYFRVACNITQLLFNSMFITQHYTISVQMTQNVIKRATYYTSTMQATCMLECHLQDIMSSTSDI